MQPLNKTQSATIHPATDVGTVTLKVADLGRSLKFYNDLIGLQTFRQGANTASLGVADRPILNLEALPGATPQPRGTTGLYHAAILLPSRHALAVKVSQLAAIRYPLGYSDHLVSEAFYLSDPDGNGLELYRDRPRSEWPRRDGRVQMASDPIDFDSLFAEVADGDEALSNPALPAGTKLGHMHLRVGDIPTAERFYVGLLGFDIVAEWNGALFVSAGGYHHHLGMNIWESRGGKAPKEPSAGLREFGIVVPDQAELERLIGQIESGGGQVQRTDNTALVLDPWQNRVRLSFQDQLIAR